MNDQGGNFRDVPKCVICKGSGSPAGGSTNKICPGCDYALERGLDPLRADTHQRAFEAQNKDD